MVKPTGAKPMLARGRTFARSVAAPKVSNTANNSARLVSGFGFFMLVVSFYCFGRLLISVFTEVLQEIRRGITRKVWRFWFFTEGNEGSEEYRRTRWVLQKDTNGKEGGGSSMELKSEVRFSSLTLVKAPLCIHFMRRQTSSAPKSSAQQSNSTGTKARG